MRPEKQYLLDEVEELMKAAPAFIITRYRELNPDLSSAFRRKLSASGATLEVVRKRILQKALAASGVQLAREEMPGHVAIVFTGEDPIAAAKALCQFSEENEEVITLLKGKIDGAVISADDVKLLSKLPGEREMRAQLLGILQAPLAGALGVMESVLSSVPSCLEQKSKSA